MAYTRTSFAMTTGRNSAPAVGVRADSSLTTGLSAVSASQSAQGNFVALGALSLALNLSIGCRA